MNPVFCLALKDGSLRPTRETFWVGSCWRRDATSFCCCRRWLLVKHRTMAGCKPLLNLWRTNGSDGRPDERQHNGGHY